MSLILTFFVLNLFNKSRKHSDVYQYWKKNGEIPKVLKQLFIFDEPKTAGNSQNLNPRNENVSFALNFSGLLYTIDNGQNSGVSPGYKTNDSEDKNHDIFGQHLFADVRSEGDVLKYWRKDERL